MIDKDWCDMVSDYDLDCSPETLRKAGVGVKLASDAGMGFPKDGVGTHDVMDGYVERQKLYDLRREVRKDLREQSRSEMLREMIQNAVRELPRLVMLEPTDEILLRDEGREKELVIGVGDFHYGAKYQVTGLCGETLNEYDTEVFGRRLQQLGEEIVRISGKEEPNRITVMIVGDMLDGLLRASQISRLEYGVVDSAIMLSESLATWFAWLWNHTRVPIRVYAVRGNHGEIRPLGSKAGQFPEENMERIVMRFLYERFRDNMCITIGNEDAPMYQMADVTGFKFLLIHGQGGDIEKITRDYQNLYHNKIDVVMCGHLHKSQTFTAGYDHAGSVLIERVPSICGIDPYAQSKGYGSPAGATIIVMEEGYGRRCVYPIQLS